MQNFKPDCKSWGQAGKGPRFRFGICRECLDFPITSVACSEWAALDSSGIAALTKLKLGPAGCLRKVKHISADTFSSGWAFSVGSVSVCLGLCCWWLVYFGVFFFWFVCFFVGKEARLSEATEANDKQVGVPALIHFPHFNFCLVRKLHFKRSFWVSFPGFGKRKEKWLSRSFCPHPANSADNAELLQERY